MNTEAKLSLAKRKKAQGNDLFKLERWEDACLRYDAASKVVRYEGNLSAEEKTVLNTLKEQCFGNMAACKSKLELWDEVVKLATEALTLDAGNVKALFRRGHAHAQRNEHELARSDLQAALAIDPHNEAVRKALAPIEARMRAEKEKEKRLFAGLFGKVSLVSEAESALPKPKPKAKTTTTSAESAAPTGSTSDGAQQ